MHLHLFNHSILGPLLFGFLVRPLGIVLALLKTGDLEDFNAATGSALIEHPQDAR